MVIGDFEFNKLVKLISKNIYIFFFFNQINNFNIKMNNLNMTYIFQCLLVYKKRMKSFDFSIFFFSVLS